MKSHGFVVPLGTIWGKTNFFDFGSKTSEFKSLKIQNFKKIQGAKNKIKFVVVVGKCVL